MSCLTEVCNFCTSARNCSTSEMTSGHGETLVAAMVGAATSATLSASSASSSKVAVVLVEASTIRTLPGRHWRKSSLRKVPSATPARSPNNCCIRQSSWVGFLSPSSSVLKSCCSFLCSEATVRLISCSLRVVYGLSGGGCRMRSRTSVANSGERDATT